MEEQMGLFGTKKEQLLTVNEAIYAILKGGQSYRIGTRHLTRADLALLYDMQRKLQSQVMAEEEGGSSLFADTVVAVFDGR